MKRHYETDHKNFSNNFASKSEVRKNKLADLKSALTSQQKFIKIFSKESYAATEASFIMSWNIVRLNIHTLTVNS